MKLALTCTAQLCTLVAVAPGPIVAVQDDQTQVIEHWTPPGLPEGVECYIGQYKGRFLVYERTSGLKFPTMRCTYPNSYTDCQGHLVLGEARLLSPRDGEGFASVAKAKQFYAETNPAFEAANPECSTIRGLVDKLVAAGGMAIVGKAYESKARGFKDEQGRTIW